MSDFSALFKRGTMSSIVVFANGTFYKGAVEIAGDFLIVTNEASPSTKTAIPTDKVCAIAYRDNAEFIKEMDRQRELREENEKALQEKIRPDSMPTAGLSVVK